MKRHSWYKIFSAYYRINIFQCKNCEIFKIYTRQKDKSWIVLYTYEIKANERECYFIDNATYSKEKPDCVTSEDINNLIK